MRVPLLNASLTDAVFEVARPTTAEEVNALFAAAAEGPLKGILGLEMRPLVSSDFTNDPRSAIVDGPSTMVTAGTQVKVYAWYDNEWGYACRLADIVRMVARGCSAWGLRGSSAPGLQCPGAPAASSSTNILWGSGGRSAPGPPPARKRRP